MIQCKPVPLPATSWASDSHLKLSFSPSPPLTSFPATKGPVPANSEATIRSQRDLKNQALGISSLWAPSPNNSPRGGRLVRGHAPSKLNHAKSMHQLSLLWARALQYKLLTQSHQERTLNLCPDLQRLSKGSPIDCFLFLLHFNEHPLVEVPPGTQQKSHGQQGPTPAGIPQTYEGWWQSKSSPS